MRIDASNKIMERVHYERTVDIDAPPDIVWRVLADVQRWPEWNLAARRLTLENGGPLAAGWRATLDLPGSGGRPSRWDVTSLEDGRSFVWENRQPGIRSVAGHYVEPAGAGSRATLSIDMSGPLSLLLRPYFSYVTRRNVGWESEGLKRRSEELAGR